MRNKTVTVLLLLASALLLTAWAAAGQTTEQILLSFKPHVTDLEEPVEEHKARKGETAQAIDSVAKTKAERAWLIMTGRFESHYASFVDLDKPKCREGHRAKNGQRWCDGGRAWSVWQLQRTNRQGGRKRAAEIALERLRRCANTCTAKGYDYWEGGTSLYATGRTCDWKEAPERIAFMWEIFYKLD